MPPRVPRTPSLRRHKPTGQGVVTLGGKDRYLGVWPAQRKTPPEAVRAAYDRLVSEWLGNNRRLPEAPADGAGGAASGGPSVAEVLLAFLRHAEGHYRRADGTPTHEAVDYRHSLRPVRELYAHLPAADFSPSSSRPSASG